MPRAKIGPRPRAGCAVMVRPRGDLVPTRPPLPAVVDGEVVPVRRRWPSGRWPSRQWFRTTGVWAGGSGAGTLLLLVVLGAVAGPEPVGNAQPGATPPPVTMPAVPGEAVPGEAVPGLAVPGVAVPAVPGVAVPGVAVPGEAVPGVASAAAGTPGVPPAVPGDPGAGAVPGAGGPAAPAVPGLPGIPAAGGVTAGPSPAVPGAPSAGPGTSTPDGTPAPAPSPTSSPVRPPDPAVRPVSLRTGTAAPVPVVELDPAAADPLTRLPAGGAGFWIDAATGRTVLVADPGSPLAPLTTAPAGERVLAVTGDDGSVRQVRLGAPATVARPAALSAVARTAGGVLFVVPSGPAELVLLEEVPA